MSSPNILFELLRNAGYIKDDRVDLERVRRATPTEIIDLSAESAELTSAEQMPRNRSAFAHSASLSLGGGVQPCGELECRTKQVNELIQFAALYSDKVYIHNFLSNHAAHKEVERDEAGIAHMQRVLANDLQVLLRLRPLIEAERIVPITTGESWCPHCLRMKVNASQNFDSKVRTGLASSAEYLRNRFLLESKVTIERTGKVYDLVIRAPEDLLEHGFEATFLSELPEALYKQMDIRALLANGRKVSMSRRQLEKSELHKQQAAMILENVLFEFAVSQTFGASLLTERPIHIKLLQKLSDSSHHEQRNALIRKHLTTIVPFIEDLEPAELLRVRNQEADSFLLFRQALNHAIDEVSDPTSEFTERQARELYGDILEPSLARLDLKLRSARSILIKGSKRKVLAWVGAISFGLFTGMVPSSLGAAAKLLGLTKVLADLGESAMQTHEDEEVIRNEDMYFLWKVRQASARESRD